MATAQDLLDKVETALVELIENNVQSYSIDGQSYTLLDLGTLKTMRRQLQREVLRGKRPSGRLASFKRPS